jgi:hypothetical protein
LRPALPEGPGVRARGEEGARVLRNPAEPRDRALRAVSALSGVRFRKVSRLLDRGEGTAETRRRVRAVLREHGRADLARAGEP